MGYAAPEVEAALLCDPSSAKLRPLDPVLERPEELLELQAAAREVHLHPNNVARPVRVGPHHIPPFFEATLLDVSQRKASQGCMMVNTVLELADVDRELNQLAGRKLKAIENAFAIAFEQAQQVGQMDTKHSAQELATMVMTINLGLRVQSRQKQSPQQLKSIIENSLSILGLAA